MPKPTSTDPSLLDRIRAIGRKITRSFRNPELESQRAYAAAIACARLADLGPEPSFAPISAEERARLAGAFERYLRRFAGRVVDARATDVGAPFFRRARVLRLESAMPFPPEVAYAALTATDDALVLSNNPRSLDELCASEAPRVDRDLRVALANRAGVWIGASLLSELVLERVEDIPFRRANAEDVARERAIVAELGARVHPPALEPLDDGVRVVRWVVSESRLRRRTVEVHGSGVRATEEVVAELPVHPGRVWAHTGGRLVPIG